MLAVDPALYPDIEGSTDSEALFFLALTFGLDARTRSAPSQRAVGLGRGRRRSATASSTRCR